MNSQIRKLTSEEISDFVSIVINAYPGVMQNTPEFKERFTNNLVQTQENEDSIKFFGLFREGKLLGGMRIHYYQLNLYSRMIEAGGVGLVAVDLLHKKEKVAKELISFFISHFQERGASVAMLYPFNPGFYKKMGFGHGTKMNQYQVAPLSFPSTSTKEGIVFLDESHKDLIRNCFNRYAENTHGGLLKTNYELESMFKNPAFKFVGYMNNGELEGYLMFSFKSEDPSNFLTNNIVVKELVYNTPTAFSKINTFLHSQADQIHRVILNTQDNSLEFLLSDPTNGSKHLIPSVYHETNTSGTGIMYKIIDMNLFLSQLTFKIDTNQTFSFKMNVIDTLVSNQPETIGIRVENGAFQVTEQKNYDFDIELDIADCSSLFMGSVETLTLYQYGKLKISDPAYLESLRQFFGSCKQPICLTGF
ncbi:enhanced intracellular survival protein Eis [Bacillus sp. CGMCC 1.16607]|uniref:GNAT family N-acetyltransferase n=1 Tax=Bacillus sp. CGMCC 1.16607 TaxID=3351842 RepID=UPI00363E0ACF